MPPSGHTMPPRLRRPLPRKHKLMLLAAFEIVVVGFAQAPAYRPPRGILIEMSVTPNHVVT